MKQTPNLNSSSVIPVYGANATSYRTPPTDQQRENGVIPLDSLPADWWNWLWYNTTSNLGEAQMDFNSLYSEIISVLTAAGISPSESSTEELRDAIISLARTIADTTYPGAVKSGTAAGQLNVNGTTGIGTINCLGNPTSLETTSATIVGAINEVNTALETLTNTTIPGLANTYAPLDHSSTNTTYGIATETKFGHIRVCNGNGLCLQDGVLSMSASQQSSCIGLSVTDGTSTRYPLVFGQSGLCTASDSCLYIPPALTTYYDAYGDYVRTAYLHTTSLYLEASTPGCLRLLCTGLAFTCDTKELLRLSSSTVRLGCANASATYGIAIGYIAYAANGGTAIGCSSYAGSYSQALGECAYARASYSVALGNCTCVDASSPWGIAIGYCACSAFSGGVAIGYCARATCTSCCGVTVWLNVVGNSFQFKMCTGICSYRLKWCDLRGLLRSAFYSVKGTAGSEVYFIGETGGAYCACTTTTTTDFSNLYDTFKLMGRLNFLAGATSSYNTNIYWGNSWRSLCCTDTKTASWTDICNRWIYVQGLLNNVTILS